MPQFHMEEAAAPSRPAGRNVLVLRSACEGKPATPEVSALRAGGCRAKRSAPIGQRLLDSNK
eukprot:8083038-Alexandrium_andersonii.AAC.1